MPCFPSLVPSCWQAALRAGGSLTILNITLNLFLKCSFWQDLLKYASISNKSWPVSIKCASWPLSSCRAPQTAPVWSVSMTSRSLPSLKLELATEVWLRLKVIWLGYTVCLVFSLLKNYSVWSIRRLLQELQMCILDKWPTRYLS